MFTLYQTFLQQVKEEDIRRYNQKHRDYLIRSGKLKENEIGINSSNQNKGMHHKQKSAFDKQKRTQLKPKHTPVNLTNNLSQIEERPLKGAHNYNVPSDNLSQAFSKVNKQTNSIQQHEVSINLKPKKQTPKLQQLPTFNRSLPVQNLLIEKAQRPIESNQFSEFPEEEDVVLVECPLNCGRKFNEKAIQKHIKICQKAEKKRKVFKVKVVDEEAQQLKKEQPKQEVKKNVPKWKKESNQLRKAICNQTQNAKTGEAKPVEEEVDDRVECPGCGRKFNADPAKKHIPGCVQRNKGKGK